MSDEKPNAGLLSMLNAWLAHKDRGQKYKCARGYGDRLIHDACEACLISESAKELSRLTLACRERDAQNKALVSQLEGEAVAQDSLRMQCESLRAQLAERDERILELNMQFGGLRTQLEVSEKRLSAALRECMMRDPRQQSDLEGRN